MKRMSSTCALAAAVILTSGTAFAQGTQSAPQTPGTAMTAPSAPAGPDAANSQNSPGASGNMPAVSGSPAATEVPVFRPDSLNSRSGSSAGSSWNSVPDSTGAGASGLGVPSIMDVDGTGRQSSIDVTR